MGGSETDPLLRSQTKNVHDATFNSYTFSNVNQSRFSRRRISVLFLLSVTISITIVAFRFSNMSLFDTLQIVVQDDFIGYEYIVVGAGPAGIIVATTLAKKLMKEAADARFQPGKVLLIESGTRSQSAVEEKIREMKGLTLNSTLPLNAFDIPLAWSMLSKSSNIFHSRSSILSHQWASDTIDFL